ncbi:hypothetical protein BCV73_08790 [Paenibacillus sp. SSG-1]|uniref:YopX family protein n=1 Tax=Paenibacillus sp. SSG-1 TaxID=1443669 RepID=UPI000B7E43BE|nr:YopX family protein [Paenibacillus sp. SSG-1]OXL83164.1 hypothetical protein BCV73_08790 [Paenibacillus sp. SSG-1]
MREIRFRGKGIYSGYWVYGSLVKAREGIYIIDHEYYSRTEVDPETVGQYTGVHDDTEDAAKLFDGDIVQVEYEETKHICKVQYCGCGYMFVADSLPDGYLWLSNFIEFDRKYCWAEGTVKLGNIYENPEVLEVTNEPRN